MDPWPSITALYTSQGPPAWRGWREKIKPAIKVDMYLFMKISLNPQRLFSIETENVFKRKYPFWGIS
jgi:hypothetical protein